MFIAFFVLMESMERFLEPQEIKTERLLLVSFLGLLVNLVGIYAFHSHSGTHGHSHGGGSDVVYHSEEEEEEADAHGHSHQGVSSLYNCIYICSHH